MSSALLPKFVLHKGHWACLPELALCLKHLVRHSVWVCHWTGCTRSRQIGIIPTICLRVPRGQSGLHKRILLTKSRGLWDWDGRAGVIKGQKCKNLFRWSEAVSSEQVWKGNGQKRKVCQGFMIPQSQTYVFISNKILLRRKIFCVIHWVCFSPRKFCLFTHI